MVERRVRWCWGWCQGSGGAGDEGGFAEGGDFVLVGFFQLGDVGESLTVH